RELKKAFRDSVDDYLEFCARRGEQPDKPYSGQFVTRIPPELHRRLNIAASGIGRALVVELIRRRANVVAMGRRADRLQSLAAEVAAPERYRFLTGDVTRREDRAAALEMARREFGGLDCLVNNAGIGALGRF